jgi:hypothetical protein
MLMSHSAGCGTFTTKLLGDFRAVPAQLAAIQSATAPENLRLNLSDNRHDDCEIEVLHYSDDFAI